MRSTRCSPHNEYLYFVYLLDFCIAQFECGGNCSRDGKYGATRTRECAYPIPTMHGEWSITISQPSPGSNTAQKSSETAGVLNNTGASTDNTGSRQRNLSVLGAPEYQAISQHPDAITAMVTHPEAVWCLAAQGQQGELKLMTVRVEKGKAHHRFQHHTSQVVGMGLSRDCGFCLVASRDKSLSALDLNTGKFTVCNANKNVNVGVFRALSTTHRDGILYGASFTDAGKIPIWSARGLQIEFVTELLPVETRARPSAIAFENTGNDSHSGNYLVLGHEDGSASRWDVRNPKEPTHVAGFTYGLVGFSCSSRMVS
eukprot:m.596693 g.596693  ORF g.596693 m.596693 type:complete len:314 (+) comp22414_c0_seq12:754-1695(+)